MEKKVRSYTTTTAFQQKFLDQCPEVEDSLQYYKISRNHLNGHIEVLVQTYFGQSKEMHTAYIPVSEVPAAIIEDFLRSPNDIWEEITCPAWES